MPVPTEYVRVERRADLGIITLQRPAAINALNLDMIRALDAQLVAWADDDSVEAVVIDGDGDRGLCAGGDIKAMYTAARTDGVAARELWREEYLLNARIARYRKPVHAWMHGIVLGGGVGISAHASVRVVFPNSRIGMPEVTIGMVPDVGGTWLLARAPGEIGTHFGLTGTSLGPGEAVAAGLADVEAPTAALEQLRAAGDARALTAIVAATGVPARSDALEDLRGWVDACYAGDSVLEILGRLSRSEAAPAREAAAVIREKSPTAVAVTLAALRRARELPSLEADLDMEFRVSCRRLLHPDFAEGIRARVVDKDRAPRWEPAAFEDVDVSLVMRHFDGLGGEELGLTGDGPDSG